MLFERIRRDMNQRRRHAKGGRNRNGHFDDEPNQKGRPARKSHGDDRDMETQNELRAYLERIGRRI